jgi:hypothetical protein
MLNTPENITGIVPGTAPTDLVDSQLQSKELIKIDIAEQPEATYKRVLSELDADASLPYNRPMNGYTYNLASVEMSGGGISRIDSSISTHKIPPEENAPLRPEFNIRSDFTLEPDTYVDDKKASDISRLLRENYGYESKIEEIGNGARRIVVETREGHPFHIFVGFSNKFEAYRFYANTEDDFKKKGSHSAARAYEGYKNLVIDGKYKSRVSLNIANSHPSLAPAGIPFQPSSGHVPEKHFHFWLEESKKLTEAMSGVLNEVVGEGQGQDSLEPKQVSWELRRRN